METEPLMLQCHLENLTNADTIVATLHVQLHTLLVCWYRSYDNR